jgi:PAS domain S-box-containing protein
VQIALAILMTTWVTMTVFGRPIVPWTELSPRDYLIVLQIFIAVFAATIVPLAVVLEEKQRLNDTLANVLKETREAWGAIIGAEARYRLVVDNVSETVMRITPDGVIQFASPACVALLHGDHEIAGRNLFDLLHPEDRDTERERMNQCIAQGLLNLAHRGKWRIKGDDHTWTLIDARVTLVAPAGRGHEEFLAVLRPEGA